MAYGICNDRSRTFEVSCSTEFFYEELNEDQIDRKSYVKSQINSDGQTFYRARRGGKVVI